MKLHRWVLGLCLLTGASAQTNQLTLDEALKAGELFLRANVDERVLQALPQVDPKQAEQLLRDFQSRFSGEYILDVARVRQTAAIVLPFLEQSEPLRPYAGWLRTRMDYFRAAEELRLIVPPPPQAKPGQPKPKPVNPTPAQQRQVWKKVIATEPWPPEAKRYVPRLKPVFVSERVPGELVWLAEVESSFDANARSPAGAAGLFQLMPPTAQRMGLAMRPTDQRFNAEKSARASAKYLRTLHTEFRDWPLTLAAYNAGEGKVRRLLANQRVKTFDQIASSLPAETQMYVPKVEAVIQRREGKALAAL